MSNTAKIGLMIGVALIGLTAYVGYVNWNLPKLVLKSGKKMTIRFRGKDTMVDVLELHKKNESLQLGSNWHLSPAYGNISDKEKTLSGLYLMDNKNVIHNTFYF